MNSKDKEALAYLYELEQYRALVKLCAQTRKSIADKLLVLDMSTPGTERQVTFLQGQAFSLDSLLKKVEQIHKASTKE